MKEVKELVALCNEFIDSKVLFADRKIQKILEKIVSSEEVYHLIDECMNNFNKEKEYEKAFVVSSSGKGYFNMPNQEFKIIALGFCVLVDINTSKVKFDEFIGNYFSNEDGRKDYKLFMQKIIVPFRNLIAEAFSVSANITTVESINEMKDDCDQEDIYEDNRLGSAKFNFRDTENLDRTFELVKNVSFQMYQLLEGERKRQDTVKDALTILNTVVTACENKNFDNVYSLILGLKYTLSSVKNLRFMMKELLDIVQSQIYCD